MVGEFLLNIVFNIVESVLSILPNWDISVPTNFLASAIDMLHLAWYMLPMESAIIPIISIIFTINIFKIAISIIKTIWELLPVV